MIGWIPIYVPRFRTADTVAHVWSPEREARDETQVEILAKTEIGDNTKAGTANGSGVDGHQ